jgi:hypothetical protein
MHPTAHNRFLNSDSHSSMVKGSTTNLQQGGETPSFETPLPPLVI